MTATQVESKIPVGVWRSDPTHSYAGFTVKHTAATFRGEFGDFEVELGNLGAEPVLEGSVRVESIDVRDEALSAHLLSPDFFDAGRHPAIGFESKSVQVEDGALVVEGELTLKGATKPVIARGEIKGPSVGPDGNERIGLDLETAVVRQDYGLDWNAELPDGGKLLGDEVTISVHLELVKEKE